MLPDTRRFRKVAENNATERKPAFFFLMFATIISREARFANLFSCEAQFLLTPTLS
jgi:hypothetical protein